ncbi:hypothetical protein [uncultured Draconibacterium sp.]|uniref:hypothetical protein n=1 Tax=uncultured Draconibacterium sp. TaxID=1573823 RepID=UPI0029C803E8|nr:hypothetical protein [uncultured Draconibacterium sp.]
MEAKYDIENDIEFGKEIFENIPNELRPLWGGLILSKINKHIKSVPKEVVDLLEIVEAKTWQKAHEQFTAIRKFNLNHQDYKPKNYISLAEKTAKITFNSTGALAQFDNDSGWQIPSLTLKICSELKLEKIREEITSVLLMFHRNKKIKNNLDLAKEVFHYRITDEILWNDWDPIGINDSAPRDEYQGYVPQIFSAIKNGESAKEISKRLLKIEIEQMGLPGNKKSCFRIANKLLKLIKNE